MNPQEVKERKIRPKITNDLSSLNTLDSINDAILKVDRYYDHQYKAYNSLESIREKTDDKKIIVISGIVDRAIKLDTDLEWATKTLTDLIETKTEFVENNRQNYDDYSFNTYSKPTNM